MDRATILLIDQVENGSLKERLEKRTEFFLIGCTDNLDVGFTLAERHQPDMIILNVDLSGEDGQVVAETFALEFPASSLVLVTSSDSKRVLRYALQVGAKDVINLPIEDEKLSRILHRVLQYDLRRRELFAIQKKARPEFKIITVFNTKGGVGKTTVSLNLAVALREKTEKRVLLADMDLFSGNVALMAGVETRRSIKDMVDEINSLDKEMVDDFCVAHSSGISILPAPLNPELAGFIEADHVEKILGMVSQVYNYVIVDAPTHFHDTIIPALEMARDIIIVTTLDLAAIYNMKQCMDLLTRLGLHTKVRVVVNRVGYTGHLKVKDLEDQLGTVVQCVIPDCQKAAVDAVNIGEPLFFYARNCQASQRIEELAAKILGEKKLSGLMAQTGSGGC